MVGRDNGDDEEDKLVGENEQMLEIKSLAIELNRVTTKIAGRIKIAEHNLSQLEKEHN